MIRFKTELIQSLCETIHTSQRQNVIRFKLKWINWDREKHSFWQMVCSFLETQASKPNESLCARTLEMLECFNIF